MSERHSQAALEAIVDIAPDGVIVLDDAFRIIRYNRGAERIFGWSEADMLGEPLDRLLPLGSRAVHRSFVRAFASGAEESRRMGERRAVAGLRRSGEEFPADASISRVTLAGERTFMVMIRDVSERKRAEDRQRMLAMAGWVLAGSLDEESTLATIAEMPLPLLGDWSLVELFTEDGRVRRAAASHADAAVVGEMVGFTSARAETPVADGLRHGSTARVAHEGAAALIRDVESWLASTFPDPAALARARALGARSVLVVPLMRAGGRGFGALSLVRTRPGSGHSPEELAVAEQFGVSAALALENGRLYQEARAAVRERDDLLAIVSHDLRNPVNAIVMLTGALMARSDAGAPVSVDVEQLEAMRAAARQADGLIQDLQDVSRISAGRLRVDARLTGVGEAISQTVELFEPSAEAAGLRLTRDVPNDLPRVLADVPRVQQVLANLLVNAIKFTPEHGRVHVRAALDDDGQYLRVSVADTGPGIESEDVPRLFERYWQAPRLLRAGSGLGLFIAKGIMEAHGGTIEVDTAPGRGTTFTLLLQVG
jgi:PAS domain S-box-containing protein